MEQNRSKTGTPVLVSGLWPQGTSRVPNLILSLRNLSSLVLSAVVQTPSPILA